MKFGDVIIDGWSGTGHPRRVGIFIRKLSSSYIRLTDGEGNLWDAATDGNSNLKIVGTIMDEDSLEMIRTARDQ
jgi:hypothetical protein